MQKLPSYCRHKAKGLAYVTLHGQVKYLGKFGTEESIRRYERVIAEFLSGQDRDDVATVVELCADYLSWAVKYYVKNGKQTSEVWIIKSVIKKLRGLYGSLDVIDLRPKHLKALQQAWIVDGICRSEVNRRVGHVKRLVRWGVREEIVPPEILTALTTVPGLKRGRSGARETTPVGPVDLRHVVAACRAMRPAVADMVHLQLLLGCRPGELLSMRTEDIDRTSSPWLYVPREHKTEHRGRRREIWIGPRGQRILSKYLFGRGKCFPYSLGAYREHIYRACRRASVPTWGPNRLRHCRATSIRKRYDLEHARATLGHSKADVTEIYAERDGDIARRVARETG